MHKIALVGWILAAACLAVAPRSWLVSSAHGQPATFQMSSLLAQYPSGGPDLRAAITRVVEANPSLEDPVVAALSDANPAQKIAIDGALRDCAGYFAQFSGDRRWGKCMSRSRDDGDNDGDEC